MRNKVIRLNLVINMELVTKNMLRNMIIQVLFIFSRKIAEDILFNVTMLKFYTQKQKMVLKQNW